MGTVTFVGCRRCGAPFSEKSKAWFQNDQNEWLHGCPDGIVGEQGQVDAAHPPTLKAGAEEGKADEQ